MRSLAAWVMKKPANALIAVSGSAVFALTLPPLTPLLMLLSLALAALVTLRRGGRHGLLVIVTGLLTITAVMLVVKQAVQPELVSMGLLWGVIWLLAMAYRRIAQMSWMIVGAGFFGLLVIAGFYALPDDPSVVWLEWLNQNFRPVAVEGKLAQTDADLNKLLVELSAVMTRSVAALASVILIISLLLARWWQAMLYNPGGFRKEFHGLRLGRPLAILMLVLIAVSQFVEIAPAKNMATDMATVVWLLFFFQGMAVTHAVVAQVGLGVGWLVGIYMLLLLPPYYVSTVLSGLGFVDTWFDFRRRVGKQVNKL